MYGGQSIGLCSLQTRVMLGATIAGSSEQRVVHKSNNAMKTSLRFLFVFVRKRKLAHHAVLCQGQSLTVNQQLLPQRPCMHCADSTAHSPSKQHAASETNNNIDVFLERYSLEIQLNLAVKTINSRE